MGLYQALIHYVRYHDLDHYVCYHDLDHLLFHVHISVCSLIVQYEPPLLHFSCSVGKRAQILPLDVTTSFVPIQLGIVPKDPVTKRLVSAAVQILSD